MSKEVSRKVELEIKLKQDMLDRGEARAHAIWVAGGASRFFAPRRVPQGHFYGRPAGHFFGLKYGGLDSQGHTRERPYFQRFGPSPEIRTVAFRYLNFLHGGPC